MKTFNQFTEDPIHPLTESQIIRQIEKIEENSVTSWKDYLEYRGDDLSSTNFSGENISQSMIEDFYWYSYYRNLGFNFGEDKQIPTLDEELDLRLKQKSQTHKVGILEQILGVSYKDFLMDNYEDSTPVCTDDKIREFYQWSLEEEPLNVGRRLEDFINVLYDLDVIQPDLDPDLEIDDEMITEGKFGRVIRKGVYLSKIGSLMSKLKKGSGNDKLDVIGDILKTMVMYQVYGTK